MQVTLLLPDYGDSYDKLAERLGRAVLECEGLFGLEKAHDASRVVLVSG